MSTQLSVSRETSPFFGGAGVLEISFGLIFHDPKKRHEQENSANQCAHICLLVTTELKAFGLTARLLHTDMSRTAHDLLIAVGNSSHAFVLTIHVDLCFGIIGLNESRA